MTSEILLFWLVLFLFLVVDNIVLLPEDSESLSVNLKGQLQTIYRKKLWLLKKEAIFLNPLNLIDRVVLGSKLLESENIKIYRIEIRKIASIVKVSNFLIYTGYIYFFTLIVTAVYSFVASFEEVATFILIAHLSVWLISSCYLILNRTKLEFEGSKLVILISECLMVPAYLINLSKKILKDKQYNLCALTYNIRKRNKLSDEEKELANYELLRIVELMIIDNYDSSKKQRLEEIKKCLKT